MKILISIFALPYEIDDLEYQINQLRKASYYLNDDIEWVLDVSMCIAGDMIDWKKSTIPISYFADKFMKLSSYTDWCEKTFRLSKEIKGCVSQRKYTTENYDDIDYHIWLDTDIIFDERTLSYIGHTCKAIQNEYPYSIITPEIVKVWDYTWDCLVNEKFEDKQYGYERTNDPYKDSGIKGDISLQRIENNVINQPIFKFAGGWFTTISDKLLQKIGIPDSFSHYGLEDTFIMHAADKLYKQSDIKINQFKIKNLVVCENYKYRNNSHLINHISVFDRRDEFKKQTELNFNKELSKIV